MAPQGAKAGCNEDTKSEEKTESPLLRRTLSGANWRGARVAESGSLLRSCASQGHRGFESPPLR